MEFTYDSYANLIEKLSKNGYVDCSYLNWQDSDRCVILRHDVDEDICRAVKFAELEEKCGVRSTYFVLLTSDFYNVFSAESYKGLKRIMECGHSIGLHFDEVRYPEASDDLEAIRDKILFEAGMLGNALDTKIEVVSMHRPGKKMLESNLEIPGIINAYGQTYMKEFKYLSDSRRRWREPVDDIIDEGSYSRLHILTHAIWYSHEPKTIEDVLSEFVNEASSDRYDILDSNIKDLGSLISRP